MTSPVKCYSLSLFACPPHPRPLGGFFVSTLPSRSVRTFSECVGRGEVVVKTGGVRFAEHRVEKILATFRRPDLDNFLFFFFFCLLGAMYLGVGGMKEKWGGGTKVEGEDVRRVDLEKRTFLAVRSKRKFSRRRKFYTFL